MTTGTTNSALLAHLRNRFMVGPENLATEALAFLLNQHSAAREDGVLANIRAQLAGIAAELLEPPASTESTAADEGAALGASRSLIALQTGLSQRLPLPRWVADCACHDILVAACGGCYAEISAFETRSLSVSVHLRFHIPPV